MKAHASAIYTPSPYAFYRQWDNKTHDVTYYDTMASLCEALRDNEPVRKVWAEPVLNERNMWDVYGESMLTDKPVWLGVVDREG